VAAASDGGFVVVWESADGNGVGVSGQAFDASGVPRGAEFQANTFTSGHQFWAELAFSPPGFVVVWQSAGQDGGGLGVFGRRFDAAGTPVGAEFQVNTFTSGHQGLPSISADSTGAFVVVWVSTGEGGNGGGLFGQRYDAQGSPAGGEFLVRSFDEGPVFAPGVAASRHGFVAAWQGATDGNGYDIFAQRFQGDLIFVDGFQ
jgi:hypothetical protein